MRRALVGVLGLALGLGIGAAGFRVAPALDARWQTMDAARGTTVIDRLTRNERTPLLFVPESATRDVGMPEGEPVRALRAAGEPDDVDRRCDVQ